MWEKISFYMANNQTTKFQKKLENFSGIANYTLTVK